jgi:hypothetical protein
MEDIIFQINIARSYEVDDSFPSMTDTIIMKLLRQFHACLSTEIRETKNIGKIII